MGGSQSTETDTTAPQTSPADSNLLYTPLGASCAFDDKAYFMWRIHQLELINYVIRKLSQVLCRRASDINFDTLIQECMNYKTVSGDAPDGDDYNFDIIAKDASFKGPADVKNKFAEFAEYMSTKGGRSPDLMKRDMQDYLDTFTLLRGALVQVLTDGCK